MKLIFIHFGQPPSHLSANILDVCNRFPNIKVVLISDFSLVGMESFQNYSEKYLDISAYFDFLDPGQPYQLVSERASGS